MEFSVTEAFNAVASAIPDRECIVSRDARLTYADVIARSRAFGRFLLNRGIKAPIARDATANWQSGQDHVALYLQNCPAFIEAMLGSFAARAVPINVNYRYVAEEVRYVLDDSDAKVLVYHKCYSPVVRAIRPAVPHLEVLVHVDDGSEVPPCHESVDYDSIVASPRVAPLDGVATSPDDLYIVYTGGTTGVPKGTLWRQGDAMISCFGLRGSGGTEFANLHQVAKVAARGGSRTMPIPPLIHGASQWTSMNTLLSGGTIVMQNTSERLDPEDVWRTIAREGVESVLIIGEAFGRPLADTAPADSSGLRLRMIFTGGAALTAQTRNRLQAALPGVAIADLMGSSESGGVMMNVTRPGEQTEEEVLFTATRGTSILDETKSCCLAEDDVTVGWLARTGRIPLGYLGDPVKTDQTFVRIGDTRWSVLGDRARYRGPGLIQLLGRESVTINTGGEKVFAEEVEQALLSQAGVVDAIVVGRPSARWGQEVVAVIQADDEVPDGQILDGARGMIASYKLPKALIRVREVRRSPAGKADYAWARERVSVGGSSS